MSKRKQKTPTQPESMAQTPDNTIQFTRAIQKRTVSIVPRNLKQEEYLDLLFDKNKYAVFSIGPAGTGKTLFAMLAGISALRDGSVNKLILTRPAVGVDNEQHGFLPGDISEKMLPWVQPLLDVMEEYYSPQDVVKMIENKIIELSPLSMMRGRTFKHAWIILDEAQNTSINSMKSFLTRIGDGSKMVITGDLEQLDKPYAKDNGLRDILSKIPDNEKMIGKIEFNNSHIERHPLVSRILELYKGAN